MAVRQPLRLFFGKFYPGSSVYADLANIATDDQTFAPFLTGKLVSATTAMHTRKPAGTSGYIHVWDEYIDLTTASTDPEKAQTMSAFKDIAGVDSLVLWQDYPDFLNVPTNIYPVEPWLIEFLQPTRRLSLPYPIVTNAPTPGRIYLKSGGYDPTDIDKAFRFYVVFRDSVSLVVGSPSLPVDIFYTSGYTPNTTLVTYNDNVGDVDTQLYRAELAMNPITGKYEMIEQPQLLTGHNWNDTISGGTYNTLTENFSTAARNGTYLTMPAVNDAIARLRFDYERRHQIARDGSLKHEVLLLNAATHHYYKGLIVSVSSVFLDGVPRRSEDSAQFVIQVTEEGLWVDEAWTAPNGVWTERESGTVTTGGQTLSFIDSTANFASVVAGDRVYNSTQQTYHYVTSKVSNTELAVTAAVPGITWATNDVYKVEYQSTSYLYPAARRTIGA